MLCRQKATSLPALNPWHNLSILGEGKIAQTVILPHEAKEILPSSFRIGNRSRSVNFQRVPEQELESLFWSRSKSKKKWLRSSLVSIQGCRQWVSASASLPFTTGVPIENGSRPFQPYAEHGPRVCCFPPTTQTKRRDWLKHFQE